MITATIANAFVTCIVLNVQLTMVNFGNNKSQLIVRNCYTTTLAMPLNHKYSNIELQSFSIKLCPGSCVKCARLHSINQVSINQVSIN